MTPESIINIATAEIGYQVAKGHPTKYGQWYAPNQKEFHSAAWCAMFVSWCFDQAEFRLHPIQNERGFAYCPFGLRWFKDNNQIFRNPQPGDIVFFDWGSDGVSDHVGLVTEVHPSYIKTIEGNTSLRNQSNGGTVMSRTRFYPSCCGFARPYQNHSNTWNGFYLELSDPLINNHQVGLVQTKLNELGYRLEIDNYYGIITEAAVKQFQLAKGLTVDGVVGPNTWMWLFLNS